VKRKREKVRNTTYIETIFRKYTEIYNGKKSLLTKKKRTYLYKVI